MDGEVQVIRGSMMHLQSCLDAGCDGRCIEPRQPAPDPVNHPPHYSFDDPAYEPIKVIEAWGLGFHLGNAVKYIARAGRKDPAAFAEDLEKARWYVARYIETELRGGDDG